MLLQKREYKFIFGIYNPDLLVIIKQNKIVGEGWQAPALACMRKSTVKDFGIKVVWEYLV